MCPTCCNMAYFATPWTFHQSRQEFSMINRMSKCTKATITPANFRLMIQPWSYLNKKYVKNQKGNTNNLKLQQQIVKCLVQNRQSNEITKIIYILHLNKISKSREVLTRLTISRIYIRYDSLIDSNMESYHLYANCKQTEVIKTNK